MSRESYDAQSSSLCSAIIAQKTRSTPFSSRVLATDREQNPETVLGYAVPLTHPSVSDFLHKELSTQRISLICRYLWMCGVRGNIHALHWQRMMSRTILVTENPALHLVWSQSTIYVKPLPRYLLDLSFWKEWICWNNGTEEGAWLWKEANGFIMTYSHLIIHESDFRIALELGLLPPEITWMQWCTLRMELLASRSDRIVAPRYHYGELRLSRLNFVYRIFLREPLGFYHIDRDYNTFFTHRFAWLLSVFVYASVTLTAFQTILATGTSPEGLRHVGYYFGILVLILIAGGGVIQAVLFVALVFYNLKWVLTRRK